MKESVAVILVNWNSFAVTNDCIQSLQRCSGTDFTIVLVDNGSVDGSGEKLAGMYPEVVIIRSDSNLGFTGGNNLGFQYSLEHGFTYSIMLNNDTFVAPDFLTWLVAYLREHPEAGAVQPKIFFHHNRERLWNAGSYFSKWAGFTYTKGFYRFDRPAYSRIKQVDWITGCAFMVRNEVLRSTGLLPENMFIYSEDADLSFRIHKLGYQLVYVPSSVIYHIAGMANKRKTKDREGVLNPVVHYLNQRNRIWLLKQYLPWYCVPTALLINLFYIIMVMGYFAVRGRFQKLKAMFGAVRDGITGGIRYNQ